MFRVSGFCLGVWCVVGSRTDDGQTTRNPDQPHSAITGEHSVAVNWNRLFARRGWAFEDQK